VLTVPGGAPERASGMALSDPARRRMLFGFGNTAEGEFTDLWSLQL
jgi:hypothetical protein